MRDDYEACAHDSAPFKLRVVFWWVMSVCVVPRVCVCVLLERASCRRCLDKCNAHTTDRATTRIRPKKSAAVTRADLLIMLIAVCTHRYAVEFGFSFLVCCAKRSVHDDHVIGLFIGVVINILANNTAQTPPHNARSSPHSRDGAARRD